MQKSVRRSMLCSVLMKRCQIAQLKNHPKVHDPLRQRCRRRQSENRIGAEERRESVRALRNRPPICLIRFTNNFGGSVSRKNARCTAIFWKALTASLPIGDYQPSKTF